MEQQQTTYNRIVPQSGMPPDPWVPTMKTRSFLSFATSDVVSTSLFRRSGVGLPSRAYYKLPHP